MSPHLTPPPRFPAQAHCAKHAVLGDVYLIASSPNYLKAPKKFSKKGSKRKKKKKKKAASQAKRSPRTKTTTAPTTAETAAFVVPAGAPTDTAPPDGTGVPAAEAPAVPAVAAATVATVPVDGPVVGPVVGPDADRATSANTKKRKRSDGADGAGVVEGGLLDPDMLIPGLIESSHSAFPDLEDLEESRMGPMVPPPLHHLRRALPAPASPPAIAAAVVAVDRDRDPRRRLLPGINAPPFAQRTPHGNAPHGNNAPPPVLSEAKRREMVAAAKAAMAELNSHARARAGQPLAKRQKVE